jgi:hypothetical protein
MLLNYIRSNVQQEKFSCLFFVLKNMALFMVLCFDFIISTLRIQNELSVVMRRENIKIEREES